MAGRESGIPPQAQKQRRAWDGVLNFRAEWRAAKSESRVSGEAWSSGIPPQAQKQECAGDGAPNFRAEWKTGENDAENVAGEGEAGSGAEGAVVQAGAFASASAGGMAAGDAAGGGDSGSADCRHDEIHGEDGVPDGAGGTATEDQPGAAGTDGACARMRSGVRAGAVGEVAGGSGDGAGGAGSLEEEVYSEEDRDEGTGNRE